jgi:hypothetical protein
MPEFLFIYSNRYKFPSSAGVVPSRQIFQGNRRNPFFPGLELSSETDDSPGGNGGNTLLRITRDLAMRGAVQRVIHVERHVPVCRLYHERAS